MMSQKLLNKLLSYFIIIIVAIIGCFVFIFSKPAGIAKIDYPKNQKTDREISKPITGNNLWLSPIRLEISAPSIKEQLEIYMIEPRFDFINKEIKFDVKFKNANKIKKIKESGNLHLAIKPDDVFDFSEEKTPLSMRVEKIDEAAVRVTLSADLTQINMEGQKVFESFVLPVSDLSSDAKLEDRYEFKILTCARWWGIDHFLNIQDKEGSRKERLEIDGDILFVEEGDVLIFKDGKWIVASQGENTLEYPLARIKSVNSKSVDMEAWDITGESRYLFAVLLNSQTPFLNKPDQLITAVKKRTNTHISCMFDKQRIVIKEKDSLIKKDNRWKLLKKDVVLNDIKNEELFYFEKIEERSSKKYLIGYLFNPMRTNYQKIEVPIVSSTFQKRIKKR